MWIGYKKNSNPALSDVLRTFNRHQDAVAWSMQNDDHHVSKLEIKAIHFEFDHCNQCGYEYNFYNIFIEIKPFEQYEKFRVSACIIDDEVDCENWIVCREDSDEEVDKELADALLEVVELESLTQKYHDKRIAEDYEFLHIDFGISISGIEVFIRKTKLTGEASVVLMKEGATHLVHDKYFDSVEDATNWINEYQTDDIEDSTGLRRLMSKIYNDNCP